MAAATFFRRSLLIGFLAASLLTSCSSKQYAANVYNASNSELVGQPKSSIVERFSVPEFELKNPEGEGEFWGYLFSSGRYVLLLGKTVGGGVLLQFRDGRVVSVHRLDLSTFEEVATHGWKFAKMLADK